MLLVSHYWKRKLVQGSGSCLADEGLRALLAVARTDPHPQAGRGPSRRAPLQSKASAGGDGPSLGNGAGGSLLGLVLWQLVDSGSVWRGHPQAPGSLERASPCAARVVLASRAPRSAMGPAPEKVPGRGRGGLAWDPACVAEMGFGVPDSQCKPRDSHWETGRHKHPRWLQPL